MPPTNFDEIEVTCLLNNDYSDMISFKNPFKDSINVVISLEASTEESRKAF